MPGMATEHLRLIRSGDGYYRTFWLDNKGKRHCRAFGRARTIANNKFSTFQNLWKRDKWVRNPDDRGPITIREGWEEFYEHAKGYYKRPDGTPTGEADNFKWAFAKVLELYELMPAMDFRALALKSVQAAMVKDELSRNGINSRVRKIRQVFKWLAQSHEEIIEAWHALQVVSFLQRGRGVKVGKETKVPKESNPITPVPDVWVWRTCEHLPDSLVAMIKIQLYTGCRPQEVCCIRTGDIDTSGKVWIYSPPKHKTAHHDHVRKIIFGPKARNELTPYLVTDLSAPIFSPKLAMRERLDGRTAEYETPKNAIGDYRQWGSYKARQANRDFSRYGDIWTTRAYSKAIRTACKIANVPGWGPNRLRHNAGTALRKEFGLEVVQAVLGHSKADTTQIYADIDLERAVRAMEKVG